MILYVVIRHRLANMFTMLTFRIALFWLRAIALAMWLLAALTFDVGSARLAEASTMGALRHRTTIFVDVLQRSVWWGGSGDGVSTEVGGEQRG